MAAKNSGVRKGESHPHPRVLGSGGQVQWSDKDANILVML